MFGSDPFAAAPRRCTAYVWNIHISFLSQSRVSVKLGGRHKERNLLRAFFFFVLIASC